MATEGDIGNRSSWSDDARCTKQRVVDPAVDLGRIPAQPAGFSLEDRGSRRDFATGSRRDTSMGKPRPDLISPFLELRLGTHLMLGACKYGPANWAKGQPSSTYWESLKRHLMQANLGLEDEDHLSAAVFNLMGIMHNQEMKKLGLLPAVLDDWPVNWAQHMHGGDPRYNTPPQPDKEMIKKAATAAAVYLLDLRGKLSALWARVAAPPASDVTPINRPCTRCAKAQLIIEPGKPGKSTLECSLTHTIRCEDETCSAWSLHPKLANRSANDSDSK